ncbi:hypothetical protein EV44_g4474 [Erysiphe necator]|uniref:Uncharacterized protein n=1 Tax=Uncinula necator TaxID=52586 RepID=A0A0B1P4P0_UNCNE|nr:hypothetical protein EV44_g4474 [Erysiphe necator]
MPFQYINENPTHELATSPTGSYSHAKVKNIPPFSAYISNIFLSDIQDHVDACNQIFDRGVLISHFPLYSPKMEYRSNLFHSNFNDSTRLIYDPVPSSDAVHIGRKYEETAPSQSPQNSKFAGNINRMAIEFQLTNDNIHATSSQTQNHKEVVKRTKDVNDKVTAPNTNPKNLLLLSAYVPDEFVYYDFENHINNESNDPVKTLATHQGVNKVDEPKCSLLEDVLTRTDVSSLINIPKVSNSPILNQCSTAAQNIQPCPKAEDVESLGLTSHKALPINPLEMAKENTRNNDCPYAPRPRKIRRAFKKIIPTENVEQFLSNPKSLSYDELYHRAAAVASLMVELQDEARVIDKELNDFEVARKSNHQISIEEAKLEKELKQREEDIVFEAMLKKYGNLSKLSVDDWTSFLKNFYDCYLDENPDNYRLLLYLRNHQFIQDFQKRKNFREKAKQKANAVRLADTIDSPPSKMEQKAMEESDRKKRKPAIDPLIFEDRKMADVYGLTHKNGDAFIGNQPLRNRNGMQKDLSSTNNIDDNFRPKRARGRRGNNDTDHSDHTPVVSDAEDVAPTKRARISRSGLDSTASSRASAKTVSSSRESSPGAGPKIFASGKRVGRPPGSSKTQVKLPSKLKSVQAAGETTGKNRSEGIEEVPSIEQSNLISKIYVDRNSYVIFSNNGNNNV